MNQLNEQTSNTDSELTFIAFSLLSFILVSLLGYWFFQQGNLWIRYERESFTVNHYQAITHAFAHLNWQHLLLNLTALVLIALNFKHAFYSMTWVAAILFSAAGSAIGMYLYSPSVDWCVGLSGALHGLFIFAVIHSQASLLWLLAIVLKISNEQLHFFEQIPLLDTLTHSTENFIQGSIVVDAHLWGSIAGIIFITVVSLIKFIITLQKINNPS